VRVARRCAYPTAAGVRGGIVYERRHTLRLIFAGAAGVVVAYLLVGMFLVKGY
jgi:hypothetical protein